MLFYTQIWVKILAVLADCQCDLLIIQKWFTFYGATYLYAFLFRDCKGRKICGQGPEDCYRPNDQQSQKPGGRTCWVGDVVGYVQQISQMSLA